MTENGLPPHWTVKRIGEFRTDESKSLDPSKHPEETFDLYSVPSFEARQPERVRGAEVGSSKKTVLPNTVLFCKINPRINRVWRVPDANGLPQIASTEWVQFAPVEDIDPDFLRLFLSTTKIRDFAAFNVSGVGGSLMRIRATVLDDLEMPVPPLNDQKQIVEEIETQFARLDDAVAALERARTRLKRYRASVLKAACEGRLVPTEAELARQEGRDYEPASVLLERIRAEREASVNGKARMSRKAAPLGTSDLPPLPEGWAWTNVASLNPCDRPCAYGVLQPGPDISDGTALVRVGDINNGKVALDDLKRIDPAIAARYPRTKLRGGEVFITLVGAIGRTAVAPHSLADANVARAVGVIPLVDSINAHWVELWFRNPTKLSEMRGKAHEVARKTLNLEDVRDATVALPPLAEQERIIAEVDRRLSVIDQLESTVEINLKRAEALRQSILRMAFSGKLVREQVSVEAG